MIATKKWAEIMLASDRGEPIQFRRLGQIDWYNNTSPQWNWEVFEYRIKPKPPIEVWFIVNETGDISSRPYFSESLAERYRLSDQKIIKLCEVVE